MGGWHYRCALCSRPYPQDHYDYCSACGAPVLGERTHPFRGALTAAAGLWRYAEEIPLPPGTEWLSLGEGATPVVASRPLARQLGVRHAMYKFEHFAPTGSFKDRAIAASIAQALSTGAPGVVCASSGNAAASAAAYAARAGIPVTIVVPDTVPSGKLAAASAYNAVVLAVPGDYSKSFALARELCIALGFVNVATTYVNPQAVISLRSVAYELAEQVPNGIDWILVPTGSGPLVHGIVSGFADLVNAGRWDRLPKVVAVQPVGCSPIVQAWEDQADEVTAWPEVSTTISGISDPLQGYPGDGTVTLRSVRETAGAAIAVRDDHVALAQERLARDEGILIEDSAAATAVAAQELARRGLLHDDDTIVCLLTGSGLKFLPRDVKAPSLVRNLDAAIRALEKEGVEVA